MSKYNESDLSFPCTHCSFHMKEKCWNANDWKMCIYGHNNWRRQRLRLKEKRKIEKLKEKELKEEGE